MKEVFDNEPKLLLNIIWVQQRGRNSGEYLGACIKGLAILALVQFPNLVFIVFKCYSDRLFRSRLINIMK